MGVWGAGNFENDAALDIVGDALTVATTEIEAFCASKRVTVEDIDAVMACVGIHLALHEACEAKCPDPDIARGLQEKTLSLYDEQIDGLKPKPEYRTERRAVLARTLDEYRKAATHA